MSLALWAARLAAGANVLLLAALLWIWRGAYRQHGARHTLGLLVVGGFLLVENLLWVGLYTLSDPFVGWFEISDAPIQFGLFALCGLETVALVALFVITRR